MNPQTWHNIQGTSSVSFKCSFCGNVVASVSGWSSVYAKDGRSHSGGKLRVCPHCTHPTYFPHTGGQVPGPLEGHSVGGITEQSVHEIYEESRRAFGERCYTASVLCCRKLLMHIAVSKGAKAGLPFVKYVDFLESEHYVPPGCSAWLDAIRKKGNEANHEILIMGQAEAKTLLQFCEMLLKLVFEFPSIVAAPPKRPKLP